MLATSLVPPRTEFTLRGLDEAHVEALRAEILSRPTSCGKLMLVIAKGLKNAFDFDAKDVDSYELEVIGANHRREALSKILDSQSVDSRMKNLYKFVYVQIYAVTSSYHKLQCCSLRLYYLGIETVSCRLLLHPRHRGQPFE